jgi:HD-GYP domain-containing protein (c-di-GMP phosphodiesterase class II)
MTDDGSVAPDSPTASGRARTMTEDEVIEDVLVRDATGLGVHERRAEFVVGGLFAATAIAMAMMASPSHWDLHPLTALVAMVSLAIASRVRFAIGGGYTVPVMLVFVPVLFLLPPPLLPLMTAGALALGGLPDVLRRRVSPQRLLLAPANAWFAVGPALVFLAGDVHRTADATLGLLIAALAAQFATDLGGSAFREWLRTGAGLTEQVNEARWVYLFDLGLAPVGLLAAFQVESRPWSVLLLLPLLGLLRVFAAERRTHLENLIELNHAYRGTALVLGDVVEADDAYTGEHTRGVVELCLQVSDAMGLPAAQRRKVEFGALLHDVGKVAIPKEIINKPGPLDEAEWEIIKTHTVEGHRMLDRVGGIMRDVGLVVRASHERWDGGGYPDGLAGEAIPIEARIVSCCDTFSAMTTTRSYRKAMPVEDAVAELRACAGTQLDPVVVGVLADLVAPAPAPEAAAARPGHAIAAEPATAPPAA